MSYMPGLGRAMSDYLETSAQCEELDLPKGEFVAKMGKAYKIALSIASFASLVIGIPSTFILHEEVGIIFLVLGVAILLILPTIISYRCIVNKISLKEEYFVLFIKFKKEVLWESVKYRKIKIGRNYSIKLYDINRKKLMSFDGATVGVGRIVKMAKRGSIKDYAKK
ncbi:MAG: hypothetical protein E7410_07380 [Ruminococcaceae bacterium]|nr:hypothetical protein [Oscillospiraceae bacterium]